jgi:hypothetical protein
MWMDIDPEAALVTCRIAEAYREAELRGLARQGRSPRTTSILADPR